ncbi:hypothetical protein B0H11DRAFT_1692962, partial [Mycena galericulata]
DGGSHFLGEEVRRACELNIVKITTPAYAPFVNGLIENTNKLLIGRLKRKCCPNLDEAEYEGDIDPASLPANWPDFFEECIAELNDRILPGTKFTPREVLFGLCLAPIHVLPETPNGPATAEELDDRLTLAEVLRMESFARHIDDRERRRNESDDKTYPIQFEVGDLVQAYDPRLDTTHKA